MIMESRFAAGKYRMKIAALFFLDALTIIFSYFAGLLIRYEFHFARIPHEYINHVLVMAPVIVVVSLVVYYFCRLYKSIWRYASVSEVYRVIVAYMILAVVIPVTGLVMKNYHLPRSVMVIGYLLSMIFCIGIRFSYRLLRYLAIVREKEDDNIQRVLLIGAGQAAREIIKDITLAGHSEYRIKAIVDDNKMKQGRDLEGIRIVGGREMIPELVKKYNINRIIFAIAHIDPEERRKILTICKDTGVKTLAVPGLYQLYSGEVRVSRLKNVDITDLLGRKEVTGDAKEIVKELYGHVVMVTGGGGSIGSELCRQIAKVHPKQLIIFDIYENSTYEIQQELKRNFPMLDLVTLIGDMTNRTRVSEVLNTYKPEIIYHAAAHKHVPLMEKSPNEAIKNNVAGTRIMAEEAVKAGVKRFLLISTDKAVNPTNIMGASKRLCEMIIQSMSRKQNSTVFMAVRFGNVLGSNGSVIPLFKKQIADGGPVTVTDKNIIRYFMTIPEAVSLVLQASYYAKGGEIFVLDMGEPVRIDDMARNLIRLSGLKPDVDIKIEYTGLRPGEKLYEELLMDEEGMTKTENDLIYIGHPIVMDDEKFDSQLDSLIEAAYQESPDIEKLVSEVVTTYHPFAEEQKNG